MAMYKGNLETIDIPKYKKTGYEYPIDDQLIANVPEQPYTPVSGGTSPTPITPTPTAPQYDWDMPNVMPDWMGPATYGKWTQSDPNYMAGELPHMKQTWWRSPSVGGGLVYHPYWGWQDRAAIKDLYKQAQGPVTWQDFTSWGLTPQTEQDWRKYYPTYQTDAEMKAAGILPVNGGGDGTMKIGPWQPEPVLPAETPGEDVVEPANLTDMLSRFGWTGPIGINPYEQSALDLITQMTAGGGPLQTMFPAQSFYGDILSGKYGPEGEGYLEDVYGATKKGALANLEDLQRLLSEKFAHRGGYFGGTHAMAQSDLARKTGLDLDQLLAGLKYTGYTQNLANMMQAAGALPGMAGTQQDIVSSMFGNLMGGGQMLTGREMTNRAEYQNALERAYNDWLRARQESMLPFQWGQQLLGFQPFQNIAQQPQPSAWGSLLGGLGTGAGAGLTKFATGGKA